MYLSRRVLAAVIGAAVLLLTPGLARAADVPRAFAGNFTGSAGGFSGNYHLPRGDTLNVMIGIAAPLDGEVHTVIADVTGTQGRISIESMQGDCSTSGGVGTCHGRLGSHYGVPEGAVLTAVVLIRAAANAPLGKAGDLVVRTPESGSTARVPLWIVQKGVSQEPTVEVSEVWGRVGDTVAEQITVRNPGPNPMMVWGLAANLPEGTELAGRSGCQDGTVGGTHTMCTITSPMEPGETRVVTLRFHISTAQYAVSGCICTQIGSYLFYTGHGGTSVVIGFTTYRIKLIGLAPSGKPASNSGAKNTDVTGQATVSPQATDSPSATAAASDSPSPVRSDQPVAVDYMPSADSGVPSAVIWAVAAIVLLAAAGGAVTLRARLRRQPVTELAEDSPVTP